jgi:hypothetical protein
MHTVMGVLSRFADNFLREMALLAFKSMSDEEHEKAVEHEKALENKKANECYRNSLKYFNKYAELSKKPPGYFEKSFSDYHFKNIQRSSSPSALQTAC